MDAPARNTKKANGSTTVQLVMMLAHLCDGVTATDHGHDPLIPVMECGSFLSVGLGQNGLRRPVSLLQCHRTQLSVLSSISHWNVRKVAQRVNAGRVLHGVMGLQVNPPRETLG